VAIEVSGQNPNRLGDLRRPISAAASTGVSIRERLGVRKYAAFQELQLGLPAALNAGRENKHDHHAQP
jgi:hypothetical protein